jgi:hypothetical protein
MQKRAAREGGPFDFAQGRGRVAAVWTTNADGPGLRLKVVTLFVLQHRGHEQIDF